MIQKKITNDEIDLIEIFQIIWEKKNSIIISIVFGLLIAFLIQSFKKPSEITAKTKIIPISIYDESKFQIYNSIAKMIKPMPLIFPLTYEKNYETYEGTNEKKRIEIKRPEIASYVKVKDTEIHNITKSLLFQMFIEVFEQRAILKNMIKKFNFIKKDDYPNNMAYEIAIDEALSEIKLLNTSDLASKKKVKFNVIISFEPNNVNEWENFLSFVEEEINQRVQIRLSGMFENYLNYTKMLNKFNVEDLEAQLVMASDDQYSSISKAIEELKKDKYSKRLVDIFNSSPISNKDEFYAAKINVDSTSYELATNKISLKTLYSSAALLSGILGIFFVLIVNGIQKRS